MVESHSHEGWRQDLCVHLTAGALEIVPLPDLHVAVGVAGPHREQVGHQGGESRGQAGLGDEAELELRQADHVITLLPVPARDVQKISLVMLKVRS